MDYFVLRFDRSYRKEDFLALSRLMDRTERKWSGRILSAAGFAVGLFAFLSGLLLLWSEEGVSELTATMLLFGGLCLVLCCFRRRLNAWAAWKQMLRVENLTMKFSDAGLAQSSSKASAQIPYAAFERLCHCRGRYFLFVDKRHTYILPEDRFVVGDAADFRPFIEAETGRRVENF